MLKILVSFSHQPATNHANFFVIHLVTGRVLRCEVFVDVIDKIHMQTTTRTVYKDHVEMLSMEATDPEGTSD